MNIDPNLRDYLDFIRADALNLNNGIDGQLIALDKTGNYRVQYEYSQTLAKLYLVKNWDVFKSTGVSELRLWNTLGNISNDNGFLKFRIDGQQINYRTAIETLIGIATGNLVVRHTIATYWAILIGTFCLALASLVCIVYALKIPASAAESSDNEWLRRLYNAVTLL